jgi:hypothetical protein
VRNGRSNLARQSYFHVIAGFFNMPQSCDIRRLYFPSEGRNAEDFFARKIRRLRPGLYPRSWVPEASMLTTNPPKPLYHVLVIIQPRTPRMVTFNPLTPNGHYSGRTAPLTSRRCILNIYSTNIRTEYFKHAT